MGNEESEESELELSEQSRGSDIDGEYIIEIQRDNSTIVIFDNDEQSGVMADTVDYLIQNHNLISRLEPLPYVPGKKNALINDKPIHPDSGLGMRTYRELTGGYYLLTNFGKKSKKRYMQQLANKCNLTIESKGGW